MKFAVVDIETTGLFHQGHDITEIAVVHIDDGIPTLAFHSLIHTDKLISTQISGLTGISNRDTNDAPMFHQVMSALHDSLKERIFVAHNVNFDFQFLKAYFEREGVTFNMRRLCTLRMAKKILPQLKSHKLGALCKYLGIENRAMHRADGDAMATAHILLQMTQMDQGESLAVLLKQNSRNAILPPGINMDEIEQLPETSGVYYFYNDREEIIYIGKAKNLKKRVLSHFTSSGSSRKKQIFQRVVARLDFRRTVDEYVALLVEDSEIKKHWPAMNVAQKYGASSFAVITYQNRLNELRFGIVRTKYIRDALGYFTSSLAARTWLQQALNDWNINPLRGGFFSSEKANYGTDEKSVASFISEQRQDISSNYALFTNTDANQSSFAAVIDGKYRGYGTIAKNKEVSKDSILASLTNAPDSLTVRAVLLRMMNDKKVMKYEF